MGLAPVPGIPARTENCEVHEERMDIIDRDINQAKGWFKGVGAFVGIVWGIAVVVITSVGNNINTKLTNIEQLLNTDKSDIRLLNEKMQNVQKDVIEIQDRHKEQDKILRIGNGVGR